MSDVRIRSSASVIQWVCTKRLLDYDDPKAIRDLLRQILGQIGLILEADTTQKRRSDERANLSSL